MRKSIAMLLVLIFLATSLTITPLPVRAGSRMIVVPDDYPTITTALANAVDGDTVFVKEGTYLEHQLTVNKTITLMGEDADNTIIINVDKVDWEPSLNFAPPPAPNAIQISANNVVVSEFTISFQYGWWAPIGITANGTHVIGNIVSRSGGITVNGNNNTISKNSFMPDVAGPFLGCIGSYNIITDNIMIRDSEESDGNLNVDGSFNLIYNNTLKSTIIEVSGNGNMIAKNNITNGGVTFNRGSLNNVIFNNRVMRLYLMGFNNTFYANEIAYVDIGGTYGSIYAANNSFYHNNFLGRRPELGVSTKTLGLLIWNKDKEGNYWVSYDGSDANDDGIGDLPYNVTAAYSYYDGAVREEAIIDCGQDNYPLIAPFDIDSVPIRLPDWVAPSPNPSPEPQAPEPFPTALVTAASIGSVTVVGAALVYFKKIKRKSH